MVIVGAVDVFLCPRYPLSSNSPLIDATLLLCGEIPSCTHIHSHKLCVDVAFVSFLFASFLCFIFTPITETKMSNCVIA